MTVPDSPALPSLFHVNGTASGGTWSPAAERVRVRPEIGPGMKVAEEFSWRPKLGEEFDQEITQAVMIVLHEFTPRLRLGARERLIKRLNALDREEA